MKRQLTYELVDDALSLLVDFDNGSEARYEAEIRSDDYEKGDGIVLFVNKQGCLAFARLFAQLAERGGHIHLGYSEGEPQGPGIRITVNDTGRSDVSDT